MGLGYDNLILGMSCIILVHYYTHAETLMNLWYRMCFHVGRRCHVPEDPVNTVLASSQGLPALLLQTSASIAAC
jgi:hypothetical protein